MASDINSIGTSSNTGAVGQVEQTDASVSATHNAAVSNPKYDAAAETAALSQFLNAEGAMHKPGVLSSDSMVLLLAAISDKMSSERSKGLQESIKARIKDKQLTHKKTIEKLEKAISAKLNSHGILGKIFGWIGVALLYVVAAAVTAVSGGAAGAPLFTAAIFTTAVMLAQQTGGMEKLMDSLHLGKEAKMAFSICVAIYMLVVNITAVALSAGMASAGAVSAVAELSETVADAAETATETAETATETAETVTETAETATETAETTETAAETTETAAETTETTEAATETAETTAKSSGRIGRLVNKLTTRVSNMVLAEKIKAGADIAAAATMIGSGGTGIDTSIHQHDAAEAQADAKTYQARIFQQQAMSEEDMEHLRKVVQQMQEQMAAVTLMLSRSHETSMKVMSSV